MTQDTKRTFKYRDPTVRLSAALKTLQKFTNHNSAEPVPYINLNSKNEKGISKIIDLAKSFIAATFSPKIRKKNECERRKVEDDVLNALDDVKRFHPIISQKQSEDAKILAKHALETIKGYNDVFENEKIKTSSWHKRLLKFLIKRSRLGLAKTHSIKLPQRNKGSHPPSENKLPLFPKILSLIDKQQKKDPLSERETDVFRMKAISLIKNHPVLFPSISQTMSTIREAPIYLAVTPGEIKGEISQPTIITLEQTLTPFPGETVILRGSFKHDPGALTPTTPMSDSFELTTESIQTGFPYPSQHNGWALADPLIPPYPLRPEYFDFLSTFLEKKERIADAFSNKTTLLEKSRKLWQLKIDSSRKNKEEFLTLHLKLNMSILNVAPRKLVPENSNEIVSKFFTWLGSQDSPLTVLSIVHRNINFLFIDEPNRTLLETWLNQASDDLYCDEPRKRFEAAKKCTLDQIAIADHKASNVENEEVVVDYIRLIGKVHGISAANLFLQYFSETLECAPPQLSEFERSLQTAALVQQENFFSELERDILNYSFSWLKNSLSEDIALFQKTVKHHPFCRELEKYYTSRFVNSR